MVRGEVGVRGSGERLCLLSFFPWLFDCVRGVVRSCTLLFMCSVCEEKKMVMGGRGSWARV